MPNSSTCIQCEELREENQDDTLVCEYHSCKVCGQENYESCTDICEDCQCL